MSSDMHNETAELLQLFVTEAGEHLDLLEQALIELEKRPLDAEELRTAFRAAHTVKGGASLLGLDAVEHLAHGAENVLASLRAGATTAEPEVVTLLLQAVDALRRMVAEVANGGALSGETDADLLTALSSWSPSEAPPATPAAAPRPAKERGPAGEGVAPGPAPVHATPPRSLHVDVAKLDRLLEVAGEIALSRRMFAAGLGALGGNEGRVLREDFEDSASVIRELQDTVMELRMVPLGPLFRRFGRAVRDVATETGKDVRLVLEGEDVEVDTAIADQLTDPLTHLVRNAVDHGIESPEARRSAGKPVEGTVTMRARRNPDHVVIEVSDDGAGVSRERLVQEAEALEIAGAGSLEAEDLRALVFQPGFSTAEQVSELSGRGVGLDVVRRMAEGLRGQVEFDSREGAGTTVTLRFPLTLSIVGGLEVMVGRGTYIVPLDSVVECMNVPRTVKGTRGIFELGGSTLPWVRLRDLFEADGDVPRLEQMLIVRQGALAIGLVVDALLGEAESIVRPLGAGLESARPFGGSAVLEDGRIGLVLDVPSLIRDLVREPGGRGAAA